MTQKRDMIQNTNTIQNRDMIRNRDMIQKLQKRLTILFTAATSLILTLVLAVAFFYQLQLTKSRSNESFQNQLLDLSHRLEGTSGFSDEWLSALESDGKLIIHIEDNEVPLFFRGSWEPETDRETLIDKAKKQALTEGISTDIEPYSFSRSKSSIFSIKGEHHDTYKGTVILFNEDNDFRSLVLLADTSDTRRALLFQFSFFFLLELIGILALSLASRHLVKKAVQPVREFHQRQTDFISAASHELRSPLAVIQTSASAILAMPEKAPKMADSICRECTRAGNLIKNLLLLSSADSGNLSPNMESLEIDAVLLQLFENYEPLCGAKGVRLRLLLPDEILPPVLGNAQWIYQILSILLDNAIAYGIGDEIGDVFLTKGTRPQSVIQLEAELQKDLLSVSVIDHGPGIPDEQKERIFERFYRADTSRTDKEHAGLGLSIAKSLAERMNTPFSVSDTKGGGSTFCISFEPVCKR